MDDKNIIKNLEDLKTLRPDADFVSKNRDILQKQITSFSGEEVPSKTGFFNIFSNNLPVYFKLIPQSALIAVFVVSMAMGGGYFSLQAAQDTLPGDSLYAAKIIGEKTQLVLTFDDRNKARLGLEFAGKRAQEITRVMSDENRKEKQGEQVEKLVVDFKKEISETRNRLEKINQVKNNQDVSIAKKNPVNKNIKAKIDGDAGDALNPEEADNDLETAEENPHVFSANLGKEEQGLKIYDASDSGAVVESEETALASEKASTTPATETGKSNPEEMINQAKNLLQKDDIDATLLLINEADEAIGQVGVGEVKGEVEEISDEGSVDVESKKATTTED